MRQNPQGQYTSTPSARPQPAQVTWRLHTKTTLRGSYTELRVFLTHHTISELHPLIESPAIQLDNLRTPVYKAYESLNHILWNHGLKILSLVRNSDINMEAAFTPSLPQHNTQPLLYLYTEVYV